MEKAACDAKGTTLFLAQNVLRTHHFRRNLSWGLDRRCIDQFSNLGHTSLAYALQVRLVKENVQLSEASLKTMAEWRHHFVADVEAFFNTIPHKFSGLQMFTPKDWSAFQLLDTLSLLMAVRTISDAQSPRTRLMLAFLSVSGQWTSSFMKMF